MVWGSAPHPTPPRPLPVSYFIWEKFDSAPGYALAYTVINKDSRLNTFDLGTLSINEMEIKLYTA